VGQDITHVPGVALVGGRSLKTSENPPPAVLSTRQPARHHRRHRQMPACSSARTRSNGHLPSVPPLPPALPVPSHRSGIKSPEVTALGQRIAECYLCTTLSSAAGMPPKGHPAGPGRQRTASHLRPDQRLKAGFEVINAAAIKLGHFLQELLVFGFKVLLHRPQLFTGLGKERGQGVRHLGQHPLLGQSCTEATTGQWIGGTQVTI